MLFDVEDGRAARATAPRSDRTVGVSPPYAALLTSAPLRIEAIELRLLRLDLVEPFETSFGRVAIAADRPREDRGGGPGGLGRDRGGRGAPLQLRDGGDGAARGPRLLRARRSCGADRGPRRARGAARAVPGPPDGPRRTRARLRRPHRAARGRVHFEAPRRRPGSRPGRGEPRDPADDRRAARADRDRPLRLGYRRIKLKIKPGWDVAVVEEVRRRHPDIPLSVDANAAYTLADRAHLQAARRLRAADDRAAARARRPHRPRRAAAGI